MVPHTMSDPARPDDGRVLWLVRHGESTWNEAGLAQGHRDDAVLTARGVGQAAEVAEQLGERPIRALYVSDLRRAMQTAAPIAKALGLAVIKDTRLRERCLGVYEGRETAAVSADVSGFRDGQVTDPDARPEGGESIRDLYLRAAGFIDELAKTAPKGEIAIVAHGGTLRVIDARMQGIPVERMSWPPLVNARVLRIPMAAVPVPSC